MRNADFQLGGEGDIWRNAESRSSVNFWRYHDDIKGAPQNSIIGAPLLWVMSGKKPEENTRASPVLQDIPRRLISHLLARQSTGYVPITVAAYEMTKKSGFYEKNPAPRWR